MRTIETKILDERLGKEWTLPSYATDGSAAIDLRACRTQWGEQIETDHRYHILPGQRRAFGTGIAVHIGDPGLVGVVASRSGLSLKHGLRVAQGIGVIDSDYTGEIGVILQHDGTEYYDLQPGERIAQLMFQPVEQVALEPVDAFSTESGRGDGGFGSTGGE